MVFRFLQSKHGFEIQEQSFNSFQNDQSHDSQNQLLQCIYQPDFLTTISIQLLIEKTYSHSRIYSNCHFEEYQKLTLSGKLSIEFNSRSRYSLEKSRRYLKLKTQVKTQEKLHR
uniref:Uncharacterized protein n=1 Tax=Spongospora subterranea TaxID=70186 RepID=A0A0H5QNT2_9EUKA|eukprot:CRZ03051.1 hypothetical protein [Spongospora subterranea]